MQGKMYALVGNFGFGPGPKGISVFSYDQASAGMQPVATQFQDANIGHMSVDAERHIIYAVDERPSLEGQTGGGGYLMALQIDPQTGRLSLMNRKPTLSQEPCYTCLDHSRRFVIVSHHADSGFVTKIRRSGQGYFNEVLFEDTGLVLFGLNEDGSIGEVLDVALTPGDGSLGPHPWARHHSVVADPSGELLVVCDKGLQVIHSFRLDRANGRLERLEDTRVDAGLVPRYGVFHPVLPVFYANFEKNTVVHAYRYDVRTGSMERFSHAPLFPGDVPSSSGSTSASPTLAPKHPKTLQELEEMEAVLRAKMGSPNTPEPADIIVGPDGKHLYVSTRFMNTISVLDVDDSGAVSLRECVDCGGDNPRGLCISPDGRFLFAANMNSGNVAVFSVGTDGGLSAMGTGAEASSPGNMKIVEV
jgi:6-phosphogluconolactonase (cycloisomerase 2 family)